MLSGRRVLLPALFILVAACGGGGDEAGRAGEEQAAAEASRERAEPAGEPASEEPARTARQGEQPPAEPAVVREAETSPFGFYTIQMSSWRTREKAESEVERYQSMGLEAYIQQADLGEKGTWYRVRVGRYPALSEAQQAARSLAGIDPDRTWVDNYREPGTPPPFL